MHLLDHAAAANAKLVGNRCDFGRQRAVETAIVSGPRYLRAVRLGLVLVLVLAACGSATSTVCVQEPTPRGVVDGCRDARGAWTGAWKRTAGGVVIEAASYDDAGALHGAYVSRYPDGGPHASGQYVHGRRDGRWVFTHENGKPWIDGGYVNGVPHGDWRETDYTGTKLFEGRYAGGLLDGDWTTWRPDGSVRAAGRSTAGRLEGLIVFHDPDGSRVEVSYRDNRLHGRLTTYDANGQVTRTSDYVDGVAQEQEATP
jgi:antitoxin component YwqK of YwqJK toxin-antitoxin module